MTALGRARAAASNWRQIDVGELGDSVVMVRERLGVRGWTARQAEGSIRARHAAWPPQMEVLVDPGAAGERARYALILDFRSMPFTGERFKDVFNHDREELLGLFGPFRVRQRRADGQWLAPVSGNSFLGGFGPTGGLARQTVVALFERTVDEAGDALVARFLGEAARLEEVCSGFASTLQRVYQRTVLASTEAIGPLYSDAEPEAVAAEPGASSPARSPSPEPTYPWRR